MSAASGSAPPEPARDNVVGAVLIGVAILIGLVLLVRGYGQEGALVVLDDATETTTTTVASPVTTAAPAVRPPAEVPVLVANASGKAGAAGALAQTLATAGYATVETTNGSPVTTTLVYYVPGAEGEAKAVALAVGTDPSAVRAMPPTPPVELGGASVLVMLGPDKA